MEFSQRFGFVPPPNAGQDMPQPLQNQLWNVMFSTIIQLYRNLPPPLADQLFQWVCNDVFFECLDELRYEDMFERGTQFEDFLKKRYYKSKPHRVYSYTEQFMQAYARDDYAFARRGKRIEDAVESINRILVRHGSAYRMLENMQFAPVTTQQEVEALDRALDSLQKMSFSGAHDHLSKAIYHLGPSDSPDYSASIKESISALESLFKELLGSEQELGKSTGILIKANFPVNPALLKGWSAIYGYTSGEDGVRHGILNSATHDLAEAKWFAISVSAFVSLCIDKVSSNQWSTKCKTVSAVSSAD